MQSAINTHRVFLIWLLYVTIMTFGVIVASTAGLPTLIWNYDHSHLGILMITMFVLAEIFAGKTSWMLSKEQKHILELEDWLRSKSATLRVEDNILSLHNGEGVFHPKGITLQHLRSLHDMSESGKKVDQSLLIDLTTERLHRKASITEFIGARIVWIGILATVLGVVIAFWPFMTAGNNIDQLRGRLGEFFAGIAVAFIPTAISFVLKIALDISDRILRDGIDDITERLAYVTEIRIINAPQST